MKTNTNVPTNLSYHLKYPTLQTRKVIVEKLNELTDILRYVRYKQIDWFLEPDVLESTGKSLKERKKILKDEKVAMKAIEKKYGKEFFKKYYGIYETGILSGEIITLKWVLNECDWKDGKRSLDI